MQETREMGWPVVCFFYHIYLSTNIYYFYSIIHNERKHEHQVYNAGNKGDGLWAKQH